MICGFLASGLRWCVCLLKSVGLRLGWSFLGCLGLSGCAFVSEVCALAIFVDGAIWF